MADPDAALDALAERALEFVQDGCAVGLGSGRAATAFVRRLGERVRSGLRVRGVPTSRAIAALADELAIPLVGLADVEELDVTVDGADEVDPALDLIKGRGGALVREKIVAAASAQRVILVTPDKLVPALGSRGVLPVEVTPFGAAFCARRLRKSGCAPARREFAHGAPFVSDNGNWILDCGVAPMDNPRGIECAIMSIPGVVGTGLFLGMADTVLIARADGVEVRKRAR